MLAAVTTAELAAAGALQGLAYGAAQAPVLAEGWLKAEVERMRLPALFPA